MIKDHDGFLAAYVALCTPEEIVETPASAGAVIYEAIGELLYQARNNASGAADACATAMRRKEASMHS